MRKFFISVFFAVTLTVFSIAAFNAMRSDVARAQFQGPGCAAGACNGKISVNSTGNVAVGTTTVPTDTRFLVVASNTLSSAYAIKTIQPDGTSLFVLRNDNKAAIGTTVNGSYVLNVGGDTNINGTITATNLAGTFSGTVAASNVTAGVFGAGNFAFPSGLGIATTTNVGLPQELSVYGSGYISSKLGIGVASPTYALEVAGQVKITGGSPGAGKVLTSDASGIATWQTPTSTASGFSNMSVYSTAGSDTFTVPSGVTKIMVEVWGGGGGGGGASNGSGGGAGGAGGYAKGIFTVSAGQQYSVTVGAAGDPFAEDPSAAQAGSGGSSSFVSPTSTTLLSATGGTGGYGSLSSSRNQGGAGGSASGGTGTISLSGQGGEGGIVASQSYGGTGGNAPFGGPGGNGAQGGSYTRAPGAGIWPGGGGGGGAWAASNLACGNGGSKQGCGGNGAIGGVIVWY